MSGKAGGCCGREKPGKTPEDPALPAQVQEELERLGGLTAIRERIPPKKELEMQSAIFHAVSDPLRLTILQLVKDQPLCVCVIIWYLKISGPKLSYHLNILKETGLIKGVPQGNWIIYSLTERGRRLLHSAEHAGQ